MAFAGRHNKRMEGVLNGTRAAPAFFHRYLKNVVADHQPALERDPRGGLFTHARLSDRSSLFVLPALWNQVRPPSSLPGSMCHLPPAKLRLALGSGSLPAAS